MNWEQVDKADIDEDVYYLVQTNGAEWRDFDLMVIRGALIKFHNNYIRGKPVWICKIVRPEQFEC